MTSPSDRSGIAYAVGAYGIWGLFPLFWPLVDRAGAAEILAHRVLWTLVPASALLLFLTSRSERRSLMQRRPLALLAAAAAFISVNWGVYIWAVNHGQVVDAALGYYINPILSILLGVVVLHERLNRTQWLAVALALIAVVVLTVDYGRPPWIALALATSFASYGYLKKTINGGAVATLTVESALLAPAALAYLIWLETRGRLTFVHLGWGHTVLLVAAGLITLVPLLLFAGAATRVPLSTIGLLQYLTPTVQFVLGVLVFDEAMSSGRWAGFALVWLALAVISLDVLRRTGRRRRQGDGGAVSASRRSAPTRSAPPTPRSRPPRTRRSR